jgi:hypothetical protein
MAPPDVRESTFWYVFIPPSLSCAGFALPRSALASRVLPVAGFCAGGRRVFEHLYVRHANARKPLAASAMTYKLVRFGLQPA